MMATGRTYAEPAKYLLGTSVFLSLLSAAPNPAPLSDEHLLAALYYANNQLTLPDHGTVTLRAMQAEKKKRGLLP